MRRDLYAAEIVVAGDANGRGGELKAIVEAGSAEDAVAKVRRAVGHNAAVPEAAWPNAG